MDPESDEESSINMSNSKICKEFDLDDREIDLADLEGFEDSASDYEKELEKQMKEQNTSSEYS